MQCIYFDVDAMLRDLKLRESKRNRRTHLLMESESHISLQQKHQKFQAFAGGHNERILLFANEPLFENDHKSCHFSDKLSNFVKKHGTVEGLKHIH